MMLLPANTMLGLKRYNGMVLWPDDVGFKYYIGMMLLPANLRVTML